MPRIEPMELDAATGEAAVAEVVALHPLTGTFNLVAGIEPEPATDAPSTRSAA